MDKGAWQATVHSVTKSQTEWLTLSLYIGAQHKKTGSKVTCEQHGFELHESTYFFSPNTQHRTIRSAVGWILRQGGPTVKLYVHFNCSGVSLPNPCIAQGSTVLLKLGNIPTQTYFPKSCFWISRPEPLCPLCQSSHSPELASPASPLLIPLRAILWERKGWRIFFLSHHRSIVSGID